MMSSNTTITIVGDDFHINGTPTFCGRTFRNHRIEGLLPNARMIQGVFDDLNPETRSRWDFPDGSWDAEHNTDAFIAAMPTWRAHGLIAFTLGLQGGSPEGYSRHQPWHNSAFASDGGQRPDYFARVARILDTADKLGMVVILSLFYFGQNQRLRDASAIRKAICETVDWLCERKDGHVIIEIANETDHRDYIHECFRPDRVHQLIKLVQEHSAGRVANAQGHLYAGVSFCGGVIPGEEVVAASDLILLHGNGVEEPRGIREMVRTVRAMAAYRGQPIVFNEDDHFAFGEAENNFMAATAAHASWGYFDYRMKGETDFHQGYQSMPCDWGITSARKSAFFELLREMTGSPGC